MQANMRQWVCVVLGLAVVLAGAWCGAAEQAATEDELIAVLRSDAGWPEKQEACRMLRRIGTAASVPALAELLGDERLSHMARFALEPMACPEAGAALRDALATAPDGPRTGIIISLGARRDAEAVPLLAPLLKAENPEVAGAAMGALGRIATAEAAQALREAVPQSPESLQNALGEALLATGQYLAAADERGLASAIFTDLQTPEWPKHVRMGAFYESTLAEPRKSPARLLAALGGDEPALRDMAAQIISETDGKKTTRRYARALPKLPEGGQVALLRGLAGRGDDAARDAVLNAVDSESEAVSLAALEALGAVGHPEDVPLLVGLLRADEPVAAAASDSLLRLPDAEAAMARALPEAAPKARAALLMLLAERGAPQAVPLSVERTGDPEPEVQIAALRVLERLGEQDELATVLGVVKSGGNEDVRAGAAKALNALCGRLGGDALSPVLAAMPDADTAAQIAMLRALGRIGTPKALEAAVGAIGYPDAEISDEAIQVLAAWPSQDAAPHLLVLARDDTPRKHDAGLRGYVRLARGQAEPARKAEMLSEAMELARAKEEKWLVLAAWGTLHTRAALDAVVPSLDDPEVRNEAASALITIAQEFGKQSPDAKTLSAEALRLVLEKCEDAGIRQRAEEALKPLQ